MNYCDFNIERFCSDVCGDHRRPQTLAEICRKMGICCGITAVAARDKYLGFILLHKLPIWLTKNSFILLYRMIRPFLHPSLHLLLSSPYVQSWTKVYRIFFQRAVTSRWRGKSTLCQFRNGNTSYFYKFVKCHRRRRNGHGPVPLNNEQRFTFTMSTYTRAAHHCDQRWTFVLTALRDSHSGPNLQQFQLRQLSPRLTRFHGIVKFYIFIHYIEETKPDHQQFHSISHHE